MPIGILSDHEFNEELTSITSNNVPARVDKKELGRGDKKEVPESVRATIAQESLLGMSASEVAQEFKISPQSVNAYKHGNTSLVTYNKPDKDLTKKNKSFKDRIVGKANHKLYKSLDAISDDELTNASLRDKSAVAKDMAAIVKSMTPSEPIKIENDVKFVLFAPQVKEEQDYIDIIPVED